MFKHIIVVCVGNICRSPMAEALLIDSLKNTAMQTVEVKSAGLDALVGHEADKLVIQLMQACGIDVSAHRARQLNRDMLRWADLVLVMEKAQKLCVESWEPTARGKVYRIGEWGDYDVPDPYQQSENEFKVSLDLINRGISDWVPKLRE